MSEALVSEASTAPAADTATAPVRRTPQGAALGAVSAYVPDDVVGNAAIAERLGVDEHWIEHRTGIRERHVAPPEVRLSDLAAEAGRRSLAAAGLDGRELDLLLVATTTQDELLPNAAPVVAAALDAPQAAATDVGAACTGFVSGLALAAGQVESGRARHALVIGADVLARYLDPEDRRTAALFGDGAGAVVVSAADAPGRFGPAVLRSEGESAEMIVLHHDDHLMRMQGHETFKSAVLRMSEVTHEALAAAGVGLDEVDLFVFHQANARILRSVGDRLGVEAERVVNTIDRYGNTSAASIPLALAAAEADGRLRDGATVLLAAFGSGFVWGGMVVEWGLGG